jgi:ceramide glucosyltransferase
MLREFLPFIIIAPPLVYGLLSLWCGVSYFKRRKPECTYFPPVTILKPVKGLDAESFTNFASFCCQRYPSFQIIFAVASPSDPVVPIIAELRAEFPNVDIDLVVDDRVYGPNYKVCNLLNAFPRAKYDIIIVSDSDIRVGERYLAEVCAPFSDPAVGLVTSLYRTSLVSGMACAIEAMGFTCEMAPNVLVAQKLEGLSFALGASMAVRRAALDKIGGFAALVDFLADDYQLGNMIYRAGYRLELSDYFVESILHRETLRNILSRQLRWARTMRASRPGGYFAAGLTQPFPAALLAIVVSGCSAIGLTAALVLYTSRSLVGLAYSRSFVRDRLFPHWLWLLPFRDLLAFTTWGLSFLGNRVRWRGHLFRLLPNGKITESIPR